MIWKYETIINCPNGNKKTVVVAENFRVPKQYIKNVYNGGVESISFKPPFFYFKLKYRGCIKVTLLMDMAVFGRYSHVDFVFTKYP